jgi:tRNA(Glu) U13 pseudouridine synthase TruD
MAEIVQDGMPYYFVVARFGSFSEVGFIGKGILMRDAEEAIRLYLSAPMAGDPREFRTFKQLVRSHWGQWGYLLHQAPRPRISGVCLLFLKITRRNSARP